MTAKRMDLTVGADEVFDRILGIEIAATVGHSMGDVTEGLHWKEIEERYGLVDEMLPQPGKFSGRPVEKKAWGFDFVRHPHDRPPGMSEDGHERHRLTATAVIECARRVSAEDVARVWVRDIDPANFGYLLGPQDQVIYHALLAGVPPAEVGKYATYPAAWGVTAMMAPVGVVNAGSPSAAARDARDVGRIKDQPGVTGNFALEVAAALAAGVSAALTHESSVDRIIDAAIDQLSDQPRAEVERALVLQQ